jgi:hypothetical protein
VIRRGGGELALYTAINVSVADRWSAFTGCSETQCDVYLYDFDELALYRVRDAHEGHGVQVIGLSDQEFFVADFGTDYTGYYDRIQRYDLAAVASFATRL